MKFKLELGTQNLVILIVLSVHSTEAGTAEFSDVFEFLISPFLAISD